MTDVPPEIAVARDVIAAVTAAGRCREDADLYEPAKALVTAYLRASIPGAPAAAPVPAPAAPVPVAAAPPHPVPTSPKPRADAVWSQWGGTWLVPTPTA